ncbi:beta-alanine-activating enzyme beta-propeller domain-containing protein [Ferruginibacter sp.]
MRNLFYLASIAFFLFGCSANNNSGIGMFRDNAAHNSISQSAPDILYDTKAWSFNAEAPVRSTPLVNGDVVYFGNTKGDFFALDKKGGGMRWHFHSGAAINSSAACQGGVVFFSNNEQSLFALDQNTGTLKWKFKMGAKLPYPWRFDYYFSSPTLVDDKIIIGSDDGNLYMLEQSTGKEIWKFKSKGLVRGTASIYKDAVLFGDTEGNIYALDIKTGAQKWDHKIIGEPLQLDTLGFDRKAILAAPVIANDKMIVGARDGFLYCLDANDGKLLWTVDHQVSWIISTVAVKDSFVVTGTSDGRFVQAVNLNTGKEIWKYHTPMATWSSPIIDNDKVYEGCYDGQLFCLDLKTGKRLGQFTTNGIIYSSPVINDQLLYIGSDDGHLYALTGRIPEKIKERKQFVYYDADQVKIYFKNGADIRIKNYLQVNGFKTIGTDTLAKLMTDSAAGKVIVFATDYFPKNIYENGASSILRKFLDNGGRIIIPGNNPLFFNIDEAKKQFMGLTNRRIDTVLGINYGPTDTRAFGGLFTGFANEKGKQFNLPDFWISNFGIDKKQVDIVLGENENGQASAFVKKYNNGGAFIQVWMHTEIPVNLDALIKLSERALE